MTDPEVLRFRQYLREYFERERLHALTLEMITVDAVGKFKFKFNDATTPQHNVDFYLRGSLRVLMREGYITSRRCKANELIGLMPRPRLYERVL